MPGPARAREAASSGTSGRVGSGSSPGTMPATGFAQAIPVPSRIGRDDVDPKVGDQALGLRRTAPPARAEGEAQPGSLGRARRNGSDCSAGRANVRAPGRTRLDRRPPAPTEGRRARAMVASTIGSSKPGSSDSAPEICRHPPLRFRQPNRRSTPFCSEPPADRVEASRGAGSRGRPRRTSGRRTGPRPSGPAPPMIRGAQRFHGPSPRTNKYNFSK